MTKTATVVGATSNQGAAVIDALKKHGGYKFRGLTRRPESDAAAALKKQDVEVVRADVNDYASLVSAFAGSHFIFGVTNFFELFATSEDADKAMDTEIQQGKNLANAAEATPTLEHYVWSNLPGASVKSGGKIKVPHYDSKDISAGKYVLVGNFDPSKINYPTIGDIRKNLVPFVEAILDKPEMKKGAMVVASIGTFNVVDMLRKLVRARGKDFEFIETSSETYYKLFPLWAEEGSLSNQAWTDAKYPMVLPDELGVDTGSIASLDDSLDALEI
ncbi:hypothetical protein M431DRAFT_500926 [Trichoderma harzianum CBS 226.95]|uniref:NmrA-like domain-containing protein n=1 Tax=Trichoderma harzianum CBS 226.95 TaxID=983964 RepID=A0A2T3ZV92_TRIHA|nr:hypothetical protein M431DRAFT_500926 [Trichoderma harzianum CBS 226.95]PTB48729.1 hypothetical protein M431DRAFT_500926 [Trichoderma harzianum CBS 226.95]